MFKRGLSQIVTSVLLILIVLVAVTIIWVFVRPTLDISDELETGKFTVSYEILSAVDDSNKEEVVLKVKRKAGAGNVVGLNIVLTDVDDNSKIFRNDTLIAEIETKTLTVNYGGFGLGELKEVAIAPIFGGVDGGEDFGRVVDFYELFDVSDDGDGDNGGGEEDPSCEWGFDTSPVNVCDVRISLNDEFFPLDVSHLGISNNSMNVRSDWLLGTKEMPLDEFFAYTQGDVEAKLISMFNREGLDLNTDGIVMLDLEWPVQPHKWSDHDQLTQAQIFDAFKTRIDAARVVLPNAKLVLFQIIAGPWNDNSDFGWDERMVSYKAAGNRGVYDNLDFVGPVLYLPYAPSEDEYEINEGFIRLVLEFTSELTDSTGKSLRLVPILNVKYRRPLAPVSMILPEDQQMTLRTIQEFDNVDGVLYWIPPHIYDFGNNYVPVVDNFENVKAVPCGCF